MWVISRRSMDMNRDGSVTSLDASEILKIAVGEE